MNCRPFETLLSAERDAPLSEAERTQLERHLAECPACREQRVQLAAAATAWRARTAAAKVPDPAAEWDRLRPRLADAAGRTPRRRRLAPVIWFALPLAAAAAFMLTFLPSSPPVAEPRAVARADFVEAGDSAASTMVYVDKESGWLVVWAEDPATAAGGRG